MIKTPSQFYKVLLESLEFPPTASQDELLKGMATFIFDKNKQSLLLIKGYAGTGKTTLISALVKKLWETGKKSVLIAPTGRAAKVVSGYSKTQAFTIHKKIYAPRKNNSGGVEFKLQKNKHQNTFFIVDEASMISDKVSQSKLFDNGSVLNDLMEYVYSGTNCKLILVGDTAQLPPVKLSYSPALAKEELSNTYHKEVTSFELTEVMRQQEESGILFNATNLRHILAQTSDQKFLFQLDFKDIHRLVDSYEIEDAINQSFSKSGIEDTTIIVRSNKRANLYNQQIRKKIRSLENDLAIGDYVMVVKNNYFWLSESSEAGFIANGDICEVLKIIQFKKLYGVHFAEVEIRMVDYPNQAPFKTVFLLDTLTSNDPSLNYDDATKIYTEIASDYASLPKYKQFLEIKKNPFFNALQVKFAYAITCHKSQGGQWENVFLERPYLPDGPNPDYYRWLYTALTRTQKNLYLIGFKESDFTD